MFFFRLSTATTDPTTTTSVPASIWTLTIPTNATWNEIGITVAGNSNGTSASDLGSLKTPVDIFVDNNYTLYIADRDNNRVVKYYANTTVGILVGGNETSGDDLSQLSGPKGIAVDQYGNVIVADSDNYRIQAFGPHSTIATTMSSNSSALLIGQMRDLHINVNNVIVITDSTYSRIVKFNSSSGIGTIIAGINGAGSAADQFSSPFGNFIDADETLYVADSGNHRIQMWPAGATSGVTVAGVNGSVGSSLGQLNNPLAVIIDNNGYVAWSY
ncbi:unnamed protein product [Rotaria sp. Silwood1]|nr:unnamed protein product [Rotaria sp. Silwood1]CAF3829219.1 unnamed protein product [Rotaria sp. Silwood1]CAF4693845.1 unnamed protein product [Rotaria sp. Silwood1]CAF4805450.1 unnamed protein product [Rotaria sp. Silwood1]